MTGKVDVRRHVLTVEVAHQLRWSEHRHCDRRRADRRPQAVGHVACAHRNVLERPLDWLSNDIHRHLRGLWHGQTQPRIVHADRHGGRHRHRCAGHVEGLRDHMRHPFQAAQRAHHFDHGGVGRHLTDDEPSRRLTFDHGDHRDQLRQALNLQPQRQGRWDDLSHLHTKRDLDRTIRHIEEPRAGPARAQIDDGRDVTRFEPPQHPRSSAYSHLHSLRRIAQYLHRAGQILELQGNAQASLHNRVSGHDQSQQHRQGNRERL